MLKRTAALTLLLTYLLTSAGFALNLHFCGKKLEEVKINAPAGKHCCKDISPEKDTCCKNQKLDIKVSDKQSIGKTVKLSVPFSTSIFQLTAFSISGRIYSPEGIVAAPHYEPPLRTPVRLTVMNSVFRI